MLILAIDTSGKQGSVTLARGTAAEFALIETVPVAGGTFSAQLVPVIAALLAQHNLHKNDIDAFAAASGPGSFTGLRVGLAAVKALAEVLRKPIAAISTLEACVAQPLPAAATSSCEKVLVLLDAMRSEVFAGEFQWKENHFRSLREWLLTRAELVSYLQNGTRTAACTPDESIRQFLQQQNLEVAEIPRPTSADIARLGRQKVLAGHTVSVEALDANYLRGSDAEIMRPPGASPNLAK